MLAQLGLFAVVLAFVAPAVSAWNLRVPARVSIGGPLVSVLLANVLVWTWVAS